MLWHLHLWCHEEEPDNFDNPVNVHLLQNNLALLCSTLFLFLGVRWCFVSLVLSSFFPSSSSVIRSRPGFRNDLKIIITSFRSASLPVSLHLDPPWSHSSAADSLAPPPPITLLQLPYKWAVFTVVQALSHPHRSVFLFWVYALPWDR